MDSRHLDSGVFARARTHIHTHFIIAALFELDLPESHYLNLYQTVSEFAFLDREEHITVIHSKKELL
jgi:hypothetical protein